MKRLLLFGLLFAFPLLFASFEQVNYTTVYSNSITYVGNLNFAEVLLANLSTSVYGTTVGDYDDDGKLDFAVSQSDGKVYVYYNDWPVFTKTLVYTAGSAVRDLASGTFNGDDVKLDIMVGAEDSIVFLKKDLSGRGFGSGTTVISFTAGEQPVGSLTAADYDKDGDLDLVVGHDGHVSYYECTGGASTPSYASGVQFGAMNSPYGSTSGDFNEDGYTDVVIGDSDGQAWYFYFNGSGFIPGQKPQKPSGSSNAYGITTGNIFKSNDSHSSEDLPLIQGDNSKSINYYPHEIYLPSGTTVPFRLPQQFVTFDQSIRGVSVGDFNRDEALDLLVVTSVGEIYLYYNVPEIHKYVYVNSTSDYINNLTTHEITFSHYWAKALTEMNYTDEIPAGYTYYTNSFYVFYGNSKYQLTPNVTGNVLSFNRVFNAIGLSLLKSKNTIRFVYKLQKISAVPSNTTLTNLTYATEASPTLPSTYLLTDDVSNEDSTVPNIVVPADYKSEMSSYRGFIYGPELNFTSFKVRSLSMCGDDDYGSDITADTIFLKNQRFRLTANMKNNGNVTTTVGVKFYVNGSYVGTGYVSILAGYTGSASYTWQATNTGTYRFNASMDPDYIVEEWNKTIGNTTFPYYAQVVDQPDIKVISADNLTVPYEGSSVKMIGRIYFGGNFNEYFRYYFKWHGGTTCATYYYRTGISSKGYYEYTLDCYLPTNYTGLKNVTFALYDICPANSNTTNDELNITRTVYPKPVDLAVGSNYYEDYYYDSYSAFNYTEVSPGLLLLQAKIRNIGGGDADDFVVKFIGEAAGDINSTTISIPKYSSQVVALYWNISGGVSNQKLTVIADSEDTIAEANENNNNYSIYLNYVDLAPTQIVLSNDFPSLGEMLYVKGRVKNTASALGLDYGVQVLVDGQVIKTDNLELIPSNNYSRYFYANFTVTSMRHNITVVTNPSKKAESNFTDNNRTRIVYARNWSVDLTNYSEIRYNGFSNATIRVTNNVRMPLLVNDLGIILSNASENRTVFVSHQEERLKNYLGGVISPAYDLLSNATSAYNQFTPYSSWDCRPYPTDEMAQDFIDGNESNYAYCTYVSVFGTIDLHKSAVVDQVDIRVRDSANYVWVYTSTDPSCYSSFTEVYKAPLDPSESWYYLPINIQPTTANCVRVYINNTRYLYEVYVYEQGDNSTYKDFNVTFYVPEFNADQITAFADNVYSIGSIWEAVKGYTANLVSNPSFETLAWSGSFQDWSKSSGYTLSSSSTAFSGTKSASMYAGSNGTDYLYSDTIPLDIGKNYVVSAYLQPTSLEGEVYLQVSEITREQVSGYYYGYSTVETIQRTVYSPERLSSTTANFYRLNLSFNSSTGYANISIVLKGNGRVLADGVQIEEGYTNTQFVNPAGNNVTFNFDNVTSSSEFQYDVGNPNSRTIIYDNFGRTSTLCYVPSLGEDYWYYEGSSTPKLSGQNFYRRKLNITDDIYGVEFAIDNVCAGTTHNTIAELYINNQSQFTFNQSGSEPYREVGNGIDMSPYHLFVPGKGNLTYGINDIVVKGPYPSGCFACDTPSQGLLYNWVRMYSRKTSSDSIVTNTDSVQWLGISTSASNLKKGQYSNVSIDFTNNVLSNLTIGEVRFYFDNGVIYTDLDGFSLPSFGSLQRNYTIFVPDSAVGSLNVSAYVIYEYNNVWKVSYNSSDFNNTDWVIDSVGRRISWYSNDVYPYNYYRETYIPVNATIFLVSVDQKLVNGTVSMNGNYLYSPFWEITRYTTTPIRSPFIRADTVEGQNNITAYNHLAVSNTTIAYSYVPVSKSIGAPSAYESPFNITISAPSEVVVDSFFQVNVTVTPNDVPQYPTAIRLELWNGSIYYPLDTEQYYFRMPNPYGKLANDSVDVDNPSFESSTISCVQEYGYYQYCIQTLEGWENSQYVQNSTTHARTGSYSAKIIYNNGYLSQRVPLKYGGVYKISYWIWTTHSTSKAWTSMSPSSISVSMWGDNCSFTGATNEWRKLECYALVHPIPEKGGDNTLLIYGYPGSGQVYIDDVSIEQIYDLPVTVSFNVSVPFTGSYNLLAYVERAMMPNKYWLVTDNLTYTKEEVAAMDQLSLPTDNGDIIDTEVQRKNIYRNDVVIPNNSTFKEMRVVRHNSCEEADCLNYYYNSLFLIWQNLSKYCSSGGDEYYDYYDDGCSYRYLWEPVNISSGSIIGEGRQLNGQEIIHYARIYQRFNTTSAINVVSGTAGMNITLFGSLKEFFRSNLTVRINNTLGKDATVYAIRIDVYNSSQFFTTLYTREFTPQGVILLNNGSYYDFNLSLYAPKGLSGMKFVAKVYTNETDAINGWRVSSSNSGNKYYWPFAIGSAGVDTMSGVGSSYYGWYYGSGYGDSLDSSSLYDFDYYYFADKYIPGVFAYEYRGNGYMPLVLWQNGVLKLNTTGPTSAYTEWIYSNGSGSSNFTVQAEGTDMEFIYYATRNMIYYPNAQTYLRFYREFKSNNITIDQEDNYPLQMIANLSTMQTGHYEPIDVYILNSDPKSHLLNSISVELINNDGQRIGALWLDGQTRQSIVRNLTVNTEQTGYYGWQAVDGRLDIRPIESSTNPVSGEELPANYWLTTSSSASNRNGTITIDMGYVNVLKQVLVYDMYAGKTHSKCNKFDVYTSIDSSTWTYRNLSINTTSGLPYSPTVANFTPSLARYFKVICFPNSTTYTTGLAELELVPQKYYNVSSSGYTGANVPSNAIDEDNSTYYESDVIPSPVQVVSFTLDAGRPVFINGVHMISGLSSGLISEYQIYFSNDSSTWGQVFFGSGETNTSKYIYLSQNHTARYVRVNVTATDDVQIATIHELELLWNNQSYYTITNHHYNVFLPNTMQEILSNINVRVNADFVYLNENAPVVKPGANSTEAIVTQDDTTWIIDSRDHTDFWNYYRIHAYRAPNVYAIETHPFTNSYSYYSYNYINNVSYSPRGYDFYYNRTESIFNASKDNIVATYTNFDTDSSYAHMYMAEPIRMYVNLNQTFLNPIESSSTNGLFVSYATNPTYYGQNSQVRLFIYNLHKERNESMAIAMFLANVDTDFSKLIWRGNLVSNATTNLTIPINYTSPAKSDFTNGYSTHSAQSQATISYCPGGTKTYIYADPGGTVSWSSAAFSNYLDSVDFATLYWRGVLPTAVSNNFTLKVNGTSYVQFNGTSSNVTWGNLKFTKECQVSYSGKAMSSGLFELKLPMSMVSQGGVNLSIVSSATNTVRVGAYVANDVCQSVVSQCPCAFTSSSSSFDVEVNISFDTDNWSSWYIYPFSGSSSINSSNSTKHGYNDSQWLVDIARPITVWTWDSYSGSGWWTQQFKDIQTTWNDYCAYGGYVARRHFNNDLYMRSVNARYRGFQDLYSYYGGGIGTIWSNNNSYVTSPAYGWTTKELNSSLIQAFDNVVALLGIDPSVTITGYVPVIVTDLLVLDIYGNETVCSNEIMNVTVSVQNTGDLPAGNFSILVYAGDVNNPIYSVDGESLGSSESKLLSFLWNVSDNFGNVTLGAIIDVHNIISESNEYNNERSSEIELCAGCSIAELVISPADIVTQDIQEGENETVYVTVSNAGNITASSIEIKSYVDGVLVNDRLEDLDTLERVTFNFTVQNLSNGIHKVEVNVDPDNLIPECNDNDICNVTISGSIMNNNASKSFRVVRTSGYDLSISNLYTSTSFDSANLSGVTKLVAVVENLGDSVGNFTVRFFDLDNSSTIGYVNVSSMAPRSYVSVSIDYHVNVSMLRNNNIKATVDYYNVITEENESNNELSNYIYWDNICSSLGPIITVYSPLNRTYGTNTIQVNFTASSLVGVGSLWYYNETDNRSYSSPESIYLPDGVYEFSFYANDTLGRNATSTVVFTIDTSGAYLPAPQSYQAYDSAFRILYVLMNETLVALNASTGSPMWSYSVSPAVISQVAVSASHRVAFGDTAGDVYILNGTTGSVVWSLDLAEPVRFLSISDDHLFVTTDSFVYGVCGFAVPVENPPIISSMSYNSTVADRDVNFTAKILDDRNISGYIFSFDNCLGSFVDDDWVAVDSQKHYFSVSKTLGSASGCTVRWKLRANDSAANWTTSDIQSFVATVDMPPTYDNSTANWTGEMAGSTINVSLDWSDDVGLIGFILSVDNGTGTFVNESWAEFSGLSNLSDATISLNSTVNSTIQWTVFAYDTEGQINQSEIYFFNTTPSTEPVVDYFCTGSAGGYDGFVRKTGSVYSKDTSSNVVRIGRSADGSTYYLGFADFNISTVTNHSIIHWVKVNYTVATAGTDDCSSFYIRKLPRAASNYSDNSTDNLALYGAIMNTSVLTYVTADGSPTGSKQFALGSNATADIEDSINSGLFSLGFDRTCTGVNSDLYSAESGSATICILVNHTPNIDRYPRYYNNTIGWNTTITGLDAQFSLEWQDDYNLSGYIFSYDNCTGTLVNDSWVDLNAGMINWTNVTKVLNSTSGCTIRWQFHVNDSSNQTNSTEIYSFATTSDAIVRICSNSTGSQDGSVLRYYSWVGGTDYARENSTNVSYIGYYSTLDSTYNYSTFVDFNLSALPLGSYVNSVNITYNVTAIGSSDCQNTEIRKLPNPAQSYTDDSSGNQELYNAVIDSSVEEYVTGDIGTLGNHSYDLGYDSRPDIEDARENGLIGLGFGTTCTSSRASIANEEAAGWPCLVINYTVPTADMYPRYDDSTSSWNSTLNSSTANILLRWRDDRNLSGYIFSFDNCAGSFTNDSWVEFSGRSNWTNVTKVLSSTSDCTVRWMVFTNDSANQVNVSQIFSFQTTSYETITICVNDTDSFDGQVYNYSDIVGLTTYGRDNTSALMRLGKYSDGWSTYRYQSFIDFDLSNISESYYINQVDLKYYVSRSGGVGCPDAEIRLLPNMSIDYLNTVAENSELFSAIIDSNVVEYVSGLLNSTGYLQYDLSEKAAYDLQSQVPYGYYSIGLGNTVCTNYAEIIAKETGSNTACLIVNYSKSGTDKPPRFETETASWNNTVSGGSVFFSLKWRDDRNLSGYIFSFDNCDGSFTNDSWASLEGRVNFTTATKTLTASEDCTVRWMVFTNDSSNQFNASDIYSFYINGTGYCGNYVCEAGEDCTNCIIDCYDVMCYCGDLTCNWPNEDVNICPIDCGGYDVGTCNYNDICEAGENCNGCQHDCYGVTCGCGDRICQSPDEDGLSCPTDCSGYGGGGIYCGDSSCDSGENCVNCLTDCYGYACYCGDMTCDVPDESVGNCPGDCNVPPIYDNSTAAWNSTIAGASVKFSLEWTDDIALSGFIFSFDNGTGTFVNDSFTSMSGTTNWSNVTKSINSTVGATIRWTVFTNDSSNKWNQSEVYSFIIQQVYLVTLCTNLTGGYDGHIRLQSSTYSRDSTATSYGVGWVSPPGRGYRGFMDFNVSSVPAGSTINSVNLTFNVASAASGCTTPDIRKLPQRAYDYADTGAGNADLYNNITAGTLYVSSISIGSTGVNNNNLGATAATDLAAALGSGTFSLGFGSTCAASGSSGTITTNEGGANRPCLIVNYTSPG